MPRRLRSVHLHGLALLQAALLLWKWTSALPTIDCSPNRITPAALHYPPRSLRTSSPARCKSSLFDLSAASNTLPSCSINIQPCFQDSALWFPLTSGYLFHFTPQQSSSYADAPLPLVHSLLLCRLSVVIHSTPTWLSLTSPTFRLGKSAQIPKGQ